MLPSAHSDASIPSYPFTGTMTFGQPQSYFVHPCLSTLAAVSAIRLDAVSPAAKTVAIAKSPSAPHAIGEWMSVPIF